MKTRVAAITLALFLTACASVGPQVVEAVVSDRIFCGLNIPGGGAVTQADIDQFIEEVVTPRFPDGFTVWRAKGQWRGGNEETLVIEILHPYDARFDRAVEEIADEYRTRFKQEAVMRVSIPARMDFVR